MAAVASGHLLVCGGEQNTATSVIPCTHVEVATALCYLQPPRTAARLSHLLCAAAGPQLLALSERTWSRVRVGGQAPPPLTAASMTPCAIPGMASRVLLVLGGTNRRCGKPDAGYGHHSYVMRTQFVSVPVSSKDEHGETKVKNKQLL